jgi:Protein of unknown function (DUF1602).
MNNHFMQLYSTSIQYVSDFSLQIILIGHKRLLVKPVSHGVEALWNYRNHTQEKYGHTFFSDIIIKNPHIIKLVLHSYLVGSSKNMMGGLFTNSRAMDSRFFWPPERLLVIVLRCS